MNDPCTWTVERGFTVGEKIGLDGEGEKKWDNCNKINNEKSRKKRK